MASTMTASRRAKTSSLRPQRFSTRSITYMLSAYTLLHTVNAASITNGPLAPVTIAVSNTAWSTARDCAKGCVQYNGIWHCGYNAGYYGLGAGLGCGCGSTNGCYCNTAYASSATSWISSCVSAHCEPVIGTNWGSDLNAMLGLYDGYCKTANVEEAAGTSWTPSTKTATGASGSTGAATTGAGAAAGGPVETGGAASGSEGANGGSGGSEKQGLSQSDIVALAASLGVGIPSLLIAGITLLVQLKKKKKRRQSLAAGGAVGYVSSDSSIVSGHGQQQPPQDTTVRGQTNGHQYGAGYPHGNTGAPEMGGVAQQGGGYYYNAAPVGHDGQYGQPHVQADAGGRGWFPYAK